MEVYQTVLALGLIAVAVSERLWWDLGPNVELVMMSSVLASVYLGRRFGVAGPVEFNDFRLSAGQYPNHDFYLELVWLNRLGRPVAEK